MSGKPAKRPEDLITVLQAHEILGITSSAIYQLLDRGVLTLYDGPQRGKGKTKLLSRAEVVGFGQLRDIEDPQWRKRGNHKKKPK